MLSLLFVVASLVGVLESRGRFCFIVELSNE